MGSNRIARHLNSSLSPTVLPLAFGSTQSRKGRIYLSLYPGALGKLAARCATWLSADRVATTITKRVNSTQSRLVVINSTNLVDEDPLQTLFGQLDETVSSSRG